MTLSANVNLPMYVERTGIATENGEQCLVIVVDITERKQAKAELQLKNEELIMANAEKDKFFSIIAHDLRNPFNSFLGFTKLMAEELDTLSKRYNNY